VRSTRTLVLIKTNELSTMITNISKRLTTVALATAGSVAAFGFANTAPAQALPDKCPLFQTLEQFLSLSEGCFDMDKLYKGDAALTTDIAEFLGGQITISTSTPPTGDVHRVTYTRGSQLPATVGQTFSLAYSVEIYGSNQMFQDVSLGVDVPGETPGFTTTKKLSAVKFGDDEIGMGLLKVLPPGGGTSGPVSVPEGVTKLFTVDTLVVTQADAQFSAFTNTYTQKPQPPNIPEPSAVLGILAVAGIGAFARRKS